MDIELKEASTILNNLQVDESSKHRSQRKRKDQPNTYKNFLEFEEAIFGDILEEERYSLSEVSEQSKKKLKSAKKNRQKKTFIVHKDTEGDIAGNNTNLKDLNDSKEEHEQKKEKVQRKKKTKVNADDLFKNIREDFDTVVNLSELIDKITGYTNSEMILAVLEICLNSKNYGITLPNATRKFWDTVYDKEEWENLLSAFKPETLRKYWRILRDTNDYKKIIDTVNSYAVDLNYPGVKLLPAINAISSYITTNSISFEKYKNQLRNSVVKFGATETKKEKSVQSGNYLNKKKHRYEDDAIEEDILELDKKISEKRLQEETERAKIRENIDCNENDNKQAKTQSPIEDSESYFNFVKNEKSMTEADKEENLYFQIIDEIIDIFRHHFVNRSTEDVVNCLLSTSFNIENAYLILTDYENYKDLAYTESDDYILKNLKNSVNFNKLVEIKGIEIINERINFLR